MPAWLVASLVCVAGGAASLAQEAPTSPDIAGDTPRLQMVKVDEAPNIDGVLDDPVWRRAAVIGNFIQVEPVEGVPPTQRTEIRLLYTSDSLFVGIRAFDSEADKINATEMLRDAEFKSDDHVVMIVDTFLDRRNAFLFRVNPRGARGDGLIENSREAGDEWDGIWFAKASIDSGGWVAEVEIPFKTLTFDPNGTAWGFNIERVVRRDNEISRWSGANLDREIKDIGDAGVLEGLVGMEQGIGLDVVPSGIVRYLNDRPNSNKYKKAEPSLDAFYRITPSLTGSLTVNTDFAETEVDEVQVNLTRFELFFPEKRDFFLQDVGIFEFGNLKKNGRPFFSRRIGLDADDEVVDIVVGGKITGRVGGFNLGILDVKTDDKGGVDGQNLFVGRASLNVLDESTAGLIFTNGDPRSIVDNNLVGFDLKYRNSELFGDQLVTGDLWVQRSFSPDTDGKEMAYGIALEYPSDAIDFGAGFVEIQNNFNPALGFANRTGIRQYDASGRYRIRFERGGLLRKAETGFSAQIVTDDVTDRVETGEATFKIIKIGNDPGDEFKFDYIFTQEVLDEDFNIRKAKGAEPAITIPVGRYEFNRFAVGVETSKNRIVSGEVSLEWGEFFAGNKAKIKPKVEFRPSPHLFISAEYEVNSIRLPEGDFTTHLVRSRIDLQFTPDISWSTLTQYDNVSDDLAINSRLRWIIVPGDEIFIVVNQSFTEDSQGDMEKTVTEVVGKVGATFRF